MTQELTTQLPAKLISKNKLPRMKRRKIFKNALHDMWNEKPGAIVSPSQHLKLAGAIQTTVYLGGSFLLLTHGGLVPFLVLTIPALFLSLLFASTPVEDSSNKLSFWEGFFCMLFLPSLFISCLAVPLVYAALRPNKIREIAWQSSDAQKFLQMSKTHGKDMLLQWTASKQQRVEEEKQLAQAIQSVQDTQQKALLEEAHAAVKKELVELQNIWNCMQTQSTAAIKAKELAATQMPTKQVEQHLQLATQVIARQTLDE